MPDGPTRDRHLNSTTLARDGSILMVSALFLITLHLFNPTPPPFWGVSGHRVVATLAEERLTQEARREVNRLLGQPMAAVAPWADEIRGARPTTAGWHFINLSVIDTGYQPARDCPKGKGCIVKALDSLIAVLGDRKNSARNRAEALRFVIHLVGDLHQPLHVADRGDRGGNNVSLRVLNRTTNLHSFWDSGVLNTAGWSERVLVDSLRKRIRTRKDLDSLTQGTIADWTLEGRALARDSIYAGLPTNLRLDSVAVRRASRLAEEALLRGAVRLAAVLNRVIR